MVVDSDKVFTKLTFTGIHTAEIMGYAANNMQVIWAGKLLFTFTNDKVSKLWVLGHLRALEQRLEDNRLRAQSLNLDA